MKVAFDNTGRTTHPAVARSNWRANCLRVDDNALWNVVEVNEGDQGYNDLALAKEFCGDRKILGATYKEILIYDPTYWDLLEERHIPAAKGIPHQGPNRHWHEYLVQHNKNRPVVDLTGHMPTHAYNQPRVPVMKEQWDNMFAVLRDRLDHWEKEDVDVVVQMDANRRDLPRLSPRQVNLSVHPPDYQIFVPAKGVTAVNLKATTYKMTIENGHNLQTVTFARKRA